MLGMSTAKTERMRLRSISGNVGKQSQFALKNVRLKTDLMNTGSYVKHVTQTSNEAAKMTHFRHVLCMWFFLANSTDLSEFSVSFSPIAAFLHASHSRPQRESTAVDLFINELHLIRANSFGNLSRLCESAYVRLTLLSKKDSRYPVCFRAGGASVTLEKWSLGNMGTCCVWNLSLFVNMFVRQIRSPHARRKINHRRKFKWKWVWKQNIGLYK